MEEKAPKKIYRCFCKYTGLSYYDRPPKNANYAEYVFVKNHKLKNLFTQTKHENDQSKIVYYTTGTID